MINGTVGRVRGAGGSEETVADSGRRPQVETSVRDVQAQGAPASTGSYGRRGGASTFDAIVDLHPDVEFAGLMYTNAATAGNQRGWRATYSTLYCLHNAGHSRARVSTRGGEVGHASVCMFGSNVPCLAPAFL